MKLVFVGAGSHRYLGIARSMMGTPGLMDSGSIDLYDPAVHRAEAVGRMAMKSPEYAKANCRINWGMTLDEALTGADIVYVVLMAGNARNFTQLSTACPKHGFIGSDQLSPSGAMLALKGGPILLDIARRMEKLCPNAWLVDYANPVAVLSAAVNNHTSIRCMGVCGGYTNHQWDLTRLLYGKDEQWTDYNIRCAGVNHMNFILRGSTHRGQDLYKLLAERVTPNMPAPQMSHRWPEDVGHRIAAGMLTIAGYYLKYGHMIFSSEGDGMAHLDIENSYMAQVRNSPPTPTPAELDRLDRERSAQRAAADEKFQSWLKVDITPQQWNTPTPDTLNLLRNDEDIMVQIARAICGEKDMTIATSFPNRGAVEGFKDRTVLEYTQILGKDGLRAAGRFAVPDLVQGLVSSLATHQTLLGDAIATKDPRILFNALYSYPVHQDTIQSKAMWRELLQIAEKEIPAEFQHTREMLIK
ncbi:MAG: hypothetical protein IT440_08105 [Phycisphaeraceae bacterium]|nr:hypothetical protein [Phycisphaeraceae bacterium]